MPETEQLQLSVAADHPCIPGHFPGDPIVPGVVLLDRIRTLLESGSPERRIIGLRYAKFHSPLRPGNSCEVRLTHAESDSVRFECMQGNTRIASGTFLTGNPN